MNVLPLIEVPPVFNGFVGHYRTRALAVKLYIDPTDLRACFRRSKFRPLRCPIRIPFGTFKIAGEMPIYLITA